VPGRRLAISSIININYGSRLAQRHSDNKGYYQREYLPLETCVCSLSSEITDLSVALVMHLTGLVCGI